MQIEQVWRRDGRVEDRWLLPCGSDGSARLSAIGHISADERSHGEAWLVEAGLESQADSDFEHIHAEVTGTGGHQYYE